MSQKPEIWVNRHDRTIQATLKQLDWDEEHYLIVIFEKEGCRFCRPYFEFIEEWEYRPDMWDRLLADPLF